jgi:hypothetical protein
MTTKPPMNPFGAKGLGRFLSHLWDRIVTSRSEVREVELRPSIPMGLPRPVGAERSSSLPMQLTESGSGPLHHKRYAVTLSGATVPAEVLIRMVGRNLASLSPEALASFEKTRGVPWMLSVGDEFDITIAGPWNGGVRVVHVDEYSFSMVTLEGHPEAGQIQFSARPIRAASGAHTISFQITSWARSRDGLVDLAYAAGGKYFQESTWVSFLEGVVKLAHGEIAVPIQVTTQARPFEGEVIPRA